MSHKFTNFYESENLLNFPCWPGRGAAGVMHRGCIFRPSGCDGCCLTLWKNTTPEISDGDSIVNLRLSGEGFCFGRERPSGVFLFWAWGVGLG